MQCMLKFQNCMNVASPQCRADGVALRRLFQRVFGEAGKPGKSKGKRAAKIKKGKKRKRTASEDNESWPDLSAVVVPKIEGGKMPTPSAGKHEGAEEEELSDDPEIELSSLKIHDGPAKKNLQFL